MELEELIKIITGEVIKKIKDDTTKDTRKKVLILESSNSDDFSKTVENFNEELYEFFSLDLSDKNIEGYDFVLVPKLDNRELVNISLGVPCGVKEKVIIDSILKGEKVYILEEGIEYRKYNKTSNKVFFNMYADYENKLVNFGLNIVNSFNSIFQNEYENIEEKNQEIKREKEEIVECNKPCTVEVDKKLLTERDIDKLYKSGIKEIIIKSKTVLTPLAKDYIRIKNIVIK